METTFSGNEIKIMVSNGIPYIWTPEDWYTLRVKHHVVGKFDGAIPPGGTISLGCMHMNLPLRLSAVEAQYLVKTGIARTYEVPEMKELRPPVDIVRYESVQTIRESHKFECYKMKKRVDIESRVDKIIEGKIKKGCVSPDKESIIQEELAKIKSTPSTQIVAVDLKDPWVPEDQNYVVCEFPFPKTPKEKVRLRVFEDFTRTRNYYVTNGLKFGGDFLAYPGDPINYHAEFIIICEDNEARFHKAQKIAQTRLASIVKKTLLIAFVDSSTDELIYKTVTAPYLQDSAS